MLRALVYSLLALSSCGYTKIYPGEELDRSQTARVKIDIVDTTAQLFFDGQGPKWYHAGVEVLPGEHEISGTVSTYKNKRCRPKQQQCRQVEVPQYDSKGRRIGSYYRTECSCYVNCTEDSFRAICSAPVLVRAGESRTFVITSNEQAVEDADADEGKKAVLTMKVSEEGKSPTSLVCEDVQPAGPIEYTESVGCW